MRNEATWISFISWIAIGIVIGMIFSAWHMSTRCATVRATADKITCDNCSDFQKEVRYGLRDMIRLTCDQLCQ